MNSTAISHMLDVLADERILATDRYRDLVETLLPVCSDRRILAMELVYRGWLTPFQMDRILKNEGDSLFLGSYVLLDRLGEGGMGHVYRARNWKINKVVAIKMIRREQCHIRTVVRRFQREIQALGKISHPNIVLAFDADMIDGIPFYAMEYVPSIDLERHVREEGPLPVPLAAHYIAQAAVALQVAHEHGLIHRDVKPGNLLLETANQQIRLLDLGLIRSMLEVNPGEEAPEQTRVGTMVGTPDYIAPEQIRDSHAADIRSDLYSLGCTFYFLLAGVAPFQWANRIDKLYHHWSTRPRSIAEARDDVPDEVMLVLEKLMCKTPADRFQTPRDVVAALLPYLREAVFGSSPTLSDADVPHTLSDIALPNSADCLAEPTPTDVFSLSQLGVLEFVTDGSRPGTGSVSGPDRPPVSAVLYLPARSEPAPIVGPLFRSVLAVLVAILLLLLLVEVSVLPE